MALQSSTGASAGRTACTCSTARRGRVRRLPQLRSPAHLPTCDLVYVQAELQEWDVVLFDGPDGGMALGRISQVGEQGRVHEWLGRCK